MNTVVDQLCAAAVAVATELAGHGDAQVIRGILDDAPDYSAALFVELVVSLEAGRRALGPGFLTHAGLRHARRAIGLEA